MSFLILPAKGYAETIITGGKLWPCLPF